MSKSFQQYRYTGPVSSVTLRLANRQEVDVVLNPRAPVSLPPEHDFTRSLLVQGRIAPLEMPPKAADKPQSSKEK